MAKKRRDDAWTIKRLRELWDYSPETGRFSRKVPSRGGAKIGATGEPGGVSLNGYRLISIDSVHYLAHRLAWAYVNGGWPSRFVEHVNGNRLDNRISNLRLKWGQRGEDGKSVLTQDRLKELLQYVPDSGKFFWKIRTPRSEIGDEAGVVSGLGYRLIGVDGSRFLAHRLAWFYTHGKWPKHHIDHINGERDDNRISNLRDSTGSENSHNTKKLRSKNSTGVPGVAPKRNLFLSRITVKNQIIHLGHWRTIAEARVARLLAEIEQCGEAGTYEAKRDGALPFWDRKLSAVVRDKELFVADGVAIHRVTDAKQVEALFINSYPAAADG